MATTQRPFSAAQRSELHPAVTWLVARLAEIPSVRRVALFGSRARGDHGPRSDIDLAVDAPAATLADRARMAELVEDAPTLLGIDLVRLDLAEAKLRREIERQGIVLHERDETGEGSQELRTRLCGAGASGDRGRG